MALETISVIVLFLIGLILAYFIGHRIGSLRKHREWELQIPLHRKDAIMKSRAVLSGNFSEQLAPFLPDFPFNPNEVRFIGKPIDFIAFKGMDEKNIDEVSFIEVKSGNSKLSNVEKSLKDAIDKKKVNWHEYRVPEDLTKREKVDFE